MAVIGQAGGPYWKSGSTSYTYADKSGLGHLTKMTIRMAPGGVVTVTGTLAYLGPFRGVDFGTSDTPLSLLLELGDASAGAAGQCGTLRFPAPPSETIAPDGAEPGVRCRFPART